MLASLLHCVRPFFRKTSRPDPKRRRTVLRLEGLEDRCTPTTFVVNTLGDKPDANLMDGVARDEDGNTSLRAAIQTANRAAASEVHVIEIRDLTGTIDLDSALEALDRHIYITNNTGHQGLTIRRWAPESFRLFTINPGKNCVIGGLRLYRGETSGGVGSAGYGGAILNYGDLTVTGCYITGNGAVHGGGIANLDDGDPDSAGARLTVLDTVMTDNFAVGGDGGAILTGVYTYAQLTNCALSGNGAGQVGGAVYNGGLLHVYNSSIEDNRSYDWGGGIYMDWASALYMVDSILYANEARGIFGKGGGIYSHGAVELVRCTIQENVASLGSGIYWLAGTPEPTLTGCHVLDNNIESGP